MVFPKAVKVKILVDTARRCCVCRLFKGPNVEVHHIKPLADGGENTYKNAITLCFDCHADVGHYNLRHPKGNKYSLAELKKAKAELIKQVQNGTIQGSNGPDKFLCRYYLCKSGVNLHDIVNDNLSCFPGQNPLLIKNQITDMLSKVFMNQTGYCRYVAGGSFLNREAYMGKHPDAIMPDKGIGDHSYYDVMRKPTYKELQKISAENNILKMMLNENLPAEKIAMVVANEDPCAGDTFEEQYILRDMWCAFLAITNIHNHPLTLNSIDGQKNIGNKMFSNFVVSCSNFEKIRLPACAIKPNETVVLPIAVIFPPFNPGNTEIWSEKAIRDCGEYEQVVTHEGRIGKNFSDYLVLGEQIIVNSINYKQNGGVFSQDVHQFDMNNMYTIDISWCCGSCPHLFLVCESVSYCREILAHCDSKIGTDKFVVPDGIKEIIIAELEDEKTEIACLKIDGYTYLENLFMKKGDTVKIRVKAGSQIEIIGQYIPQCTSTHRYLSAIKRNDLVGNFLRSINK